MLSQTDRIWNRACGTSQDRVGELREGDRALAAAILADGLVANGGLLHALEALSSNERRDACMGFRYFGLEALAELFELQPLVPDDDELADELEDELNERYWAVASEISVLQLAFEEHHARCPEAYAQLGQIAEPGSELSRSENSGRGEG